MEYDQRDLRVIAYFHLSRIKEFFGESGCDEKQLPYVKGYEAFCSFLEKLPAEEAFSLHPKGCDDAFKSGYTRARYDIANSYNTSLPGIGITRINTLEFENFPDERPTRENLINF